MNVEYSTVVSTLAYLFAISFLTVEISHFVRNDNKRPLNHCHTVTL